MPEESAHIYALALGSNQPVGGMSPRAVIRAAADHIDGHSGDVIGLSAVIDTAPLGPSRRRFANAALLLRSTLDPPALLAELKAMERRFGRRRGGRWAARPLDLDIILWSGGIWSDPALAVPHVAFRARDFVLRPLAAIAPDWRDPVTTRTVRQLLALRRARKPVDRRAKPL